MSARMTKERAVEISLTSDDDALEELRAAADRLPESASVGSDRYNEVQYLWTRVEAVTKPPTRDNSTRRPGPQIQMQMPTTMLTIGR